jgi:gentisate 1,2-dioxygenase
MKAILEDIKTNQGTSSFHAFRYQVPYFQFKWHYHPEFELTYIVKGNGYRIVGNSYESFSDGDLVLLGSNLPHTWSGKADGDVNSDAIVIQFSSEFISPFLEFNESLLIKKMLENSFR